MGDQGLQKVYCVTRDSVSLQLVATRTQQKRNQTTSVAKELEMQQGSLHMPLEHHPENAARDWQASPRSAGQWNGLANMVNLQPWASLPKIHVNQ